MAAESKSRRNIVFVHPDLGIGGAERLVIDAAVGLQSKGHKVTILTSYRDKKHCFEEARDGTLEVRVRGDLIFPASIGGSLIILFSILRQISLVFSVSLGWPSELTKLNPDVFIVDQLSICVPFFRILYPRAKILFYGHYPDRLLVKEAGGIRKVVKSIYRIPFDALEGWSTACSDSIVVNSNFTKSVFRRTFDSVKARELKVIYPCVDTAASAPSDSAPLWPDRKILLSINRFEGKKKLDLAIRAFAGLTPEERRKARLVLAGGFDPRNTENATCHKSLQVLADSLNLSHETYKGDDAALSKATVSNVEILFLLSIPNPLKVRLLQSAGVLIYTPTNEHFGIVPLEAMLAGVPVLATNTGGPLETIYHGRTGWLYAPDKIASWTDVMRKPLIPASRDTLKAIGQKGRERVLAEFSQTKMTESFEKEVQRLVESRGPRPKVIPDFVLVAVVMTIFAVVLGVGMMKMTLWAVENSAKKKKMVMS